MYFTELHITPFCNHHLSYTLSAQLKNACASSFENFSAKFKVYLIFNFNYAIPDIKATDIC